MNGRVEEIKKMFDEKISKISFSGEVEELRVEYRKRRISAAYNY